MANSHVVIFLLFFIVALVYSSAGFGGGSSYLALLTLWVLPYEEIRLIALLCNILVVSWNTFMHKKWKTLDLKSAWYFVVLSVPMAFLMAQVQLDDRLYFMVLSVVLVVAGILLVLSKSVRYSKNVQLKSMNKLLTGGSIGGLSGLVGIGGGIFLSPFLHLRGWGNAKKIAALSSFFILVNSLSGLLGHVLSHGWVVQEKRLLGLLGMVFLGSVLGNQLAHKKMSNTSIRKVTGILVLILGTRLAWKYFFESI